MSERPNPVMQCFRNDGHGRYEGYWHGDIPRGQCPICRAEEEQEARQRAEHVRVSTFNNLMSHSGIPPLFQEVTLDTYVATTAEQRAAVAACREFVDGVQLRQWGAPWLVGTVGAGKTHLACAMASAFMWKFINGDRGWRAVYTTPRAITRALRATWRRDAPQTEDEVLDIFGGAGLLILDEVGASTCSESEAAQLTDVIHRRYENKLPVLLVSNLPAKELRGVLSESAFDRLRQGAKVITCTWPSHRGAI